jgi:hypothetical protein
MGAKKPILAITNVEDTRKLLEQYPLSYIVDPGNPVRIAKTIKEMVNKADKSMLADEFLIPYTRSEQTRKLAQILETITEDG